jgi:glycosyltransferase involved in cell wall biosynthesis
VLPVKTYGIYLAYPPGLNLEAEGLGRHLIAFLDEARNHRDARFVIACPSWMRASLSELLEGAGISGKTFELVGPEKKPILLSMYEAYQRRQRRRRRASAFFHIVIVLRAVRLWSIGRIERFTVASRDPLAFAAVAVLAGFGLLFGMIVYLAFMPGVRLYRALSRLALKIVRQVSRIASPVLIAPQNSNSTVRLYRIMEEAEAKVLVDYINARKDVSAWYCPTAFWPHFNLIAAPRLACVPDVVLSDFPVAFAGVNGNRFLEVFKLVESTIENGQNFVTYSESTKSKTLIERYHVDPAAVAVIPHGANRLDRSIFVSGFADNQAATDAVCRDLLRRALRKAIDFSNASNFNPDDAKFLFYASQIRPNKNLISLLRAYEFLLKKRFIAHKLILTGNPNNYPPVADFIREHNLQADVISLSGLSERELAACYRLADLAVNPSLSEGGCPFTLTEALSVGTPVVMARIAVTEEIVTDTELQSMMLFDPYNWKDIATRIEFGIQNGSKLLEGQLKLYDQLSQRSWKQVVDEYVAVLDRISTPEAKRLTERAIASPIGPLQGSF